uniref:MCF.2 cell line derived transforming sequence like n=2 Tax=Scleropages formosus TaxID=113540 RepID=A0A8D0CEX2_SCLFO
MEERDVKELAERLNAVILAIDDVLQQESSPIRAEDIGPDLRKQFAFLPGGRSHSGSPIIVFPEFPAFSELSECEFHNVLTYLTSVPSLTAAAVGFVLVIDRRLDKWTSVKGTLLRIATSFPGNLQLVLVLRPTSLFHRTFSDIYFKLNKDDFKMKVPVIMLSSVTELHSYINRTQLTQELGGTQEYCHEKWISHRTAIEGFALMVKKTAQALQSFGTELAETELPNDIQATNSLLESHTEKKDRMKAGYGDTLRMNQDELENLSTVQRLLSQLDETEAAFDEFWGRHQTRLEECLQLRHFEHSFREVVYLCVQEVLEQSQALAFEGDQLVQNSHYAVDSILPKCHELRATSEELNTNLKVAKWCEDGIYLLASQPVDKCQSQDGAESALQEIEHYLSTAGHHNTLLDINAILRNYDSVLSPEFKVKLPLKEIAERQIKQLALCLTAVLFWCFLNGPGRSMWRGCFTNRHVMNELLETERAYVEELLCVLQGYAAEMDNPTMTHLIPSVLLHKKEVLFGNMSEIYHFHKRTFLRELETYTECPELVGCCFLQRMTDLQIYEKYCQNKPRSESLWRQCSDCAFFQECQKKLEHKLGLDSYLLKPVQRITKYQLLLREMLKYSRGCEGEEDLQEALAAILGILKAVNDSMHLIAITGYEGNLSDLGRLLMQGSFSVWTEHKKGHAKVKDLARFKPMQRHLFLHEKALLFCKRREENGEGYEKAPSYSFKHSLSMSAVGITENAKGDNKKFEIWCNSREEVYIVQVEEASQRIVIVRTSEKVYSEFGQKICTF